MFTTQANAFPKPGGIISGLTPSSSVRHNITYREVDRSEVFHQMSVRTHAASTQVKEHPGVSLMLPFSHPHPNGTTVLTPN